MPKSLDLQDRNRIYMIVFGQSSGTVSTYYSPKMLQVIKKKVECGVIMRV